MLKIMLSPIEYLDIYCLRPIGHVHDVRGETNQHDICHFVNSSNVAN